MPKKRLKSPNCLNCGYNFKNTSQNNYCPVCGQENNNRTKSLRSYFSNFIDDVTSIDNRFYKSLPHFLFKPGKLTKYFIEGKRKDYISPIRLYLTFSFLYFFLFSYTFKQNIRINKEVKDKTFKEIIESTPNADVQVIPGYDFNKIIKLSNKSEKAILDSLDIENTFINRLVVRQGVRLAHQTPDGAIGNFIEEIPISLFVLLPIFAFVLKLAYFRRKRYFIEHFTFILHIHSFLFLIFTLIQIVEYFLASFAEIVGLIAILILILYTYKAIRNYYQQSRLKTILKIIIVSFLYVIIFIIWLILTFLFSLIFL